MNQIVTGFKGPNVLHIMGFIQFRISAWQRIELRNSGMKGRAWAFPGQPYALGLSIFTWAFRIYPDFPNFTWAWPDEFTEFVASINSIRFEMAAARQIRQY